MSDPTPTGAARTAEHERCPDCGTEITEETGCKHRAPFRLRAMDPRQTALETMIRTKVRELHDKERESLRAEIISDLARQAEDVRGLVEAFGREEFNAGRMVGRGREINGSLSATGQDAIESRRTALLAAFAALRQQRDEAVRERTRLRAEIERAYRSGSEAQ